MNPQQASLLTVVVVIPAVMYVLYRTIVPYEPVMRDLKVGGALIFPLLAGVGVGFAHIVFDPPLLLTFWGLLLFLFLYPLIETLAVLTIFNRQGTLTQPAAPVYFGIGGAGLAMGLASAESYRTFATLGDEPVDIWLILLMLVMSTSFVLFHCSKGVFLGTYVAEGRRRRGVLMATLLEGPLGLLYFAFRIGDDQGFVLAGMLLFSLFVYMWAWHRYFPEQMSDELARALKKERRRAKLRRARRGGT